MHGTQSIIYLTDQFGTISIVITRIVHVTRDDMH